MEGKINIEWWLNPINSVDTPTKHKEALEEDAMNLIFESIKNGNVAGELSTIIRFGKDFVEEEDIEDGIEYIGWWKLV